MTPQKIIARVCDYDKLDECMLKKSRRGTESLPRDIAIYLSRCYSLKTLADIGSAFGIDNYSTVSSAVERLKLRKRHDNNLQQNIVKLKMVVNKSQ